MGEPLTPQTLEQLQRLRVSVQAFQKMVAPLPANNRLNPYNEQFNQLRLEAQALLKQPDFDQKVAPAVTEEMLTERFQAIIPRLFSVVLLGVMLALVGLGVNSIILDEEIIYLGCCVSSGGILLIMGAFVVFGIANLRRRRVSDMGDLYVRCEALLYQIDHTLHMVLPNRHPTVEVPDIPAALDLLLDSLHKQAADWQQKVAHLEEQQQTLGPDAPMALTLNLDFARRELHHVTQKINSLQGKKEIPPQPTIDTTAQLASQHTMGMSPQSEPEGETPPPLSASEPEAPPASVVEDGSS
jgi:hypothetical protein